jgi:hypothetical protein
MSDRRVLATLLYVLFIGGVSLACFRRPVADDFDRYMYEALVRGKYQTFEVVYPVIKHSSTRAEQSSILDSPTHLGELEPLYAIKPLYVKAVEATSFTHLSIQARINLISALSLFGIGIVVLGWTGNPGYSALLLSTSAVVVLGRMGTPDGLSALIVLAGLWALNRNRLPIGVLLLLLSIWIRTDNLLLVITALGYLWWQKKITIVDAGALSAISAGSVALMNHFSGNYSWPVLFKFSFLGGTSPAEIDPRLSIAQYLGVAIHSAETIVPQVMIWALLGIVAWKWSSPYRGWLIPVWFSVFAHFVFFPSPESRYLVWAFIATGVIFISATQYAPGVRLQPATTYPSRSDGGVPLRSG